MSGAQRADGAVPDGGGIRGEERRRLRLLGGSSGTGSVGRASRAISVGGVGGSIGSSGGGGSDPGGRVRGTENAGVPGDDVLGLVPPRRWEGADAEHLHGILGLSLNPDGTVPSLQSHAPPDWAPVPVKAGGLSAAERREAHKGYCFNSLVCGALPLDRSAPDTRPQGCPRQYPEAAMRATGPASVVFVFYNEALCALLRSVHSVLNRTPPHLLKEIVLVDDWSNKTTHPWLGDRLARHLRTLPKVKLVRLPKRGGLMTARTRGAEAASGKVIVFLDSHIEATKGWIEPLLSRIATHPKTFVVPRIAGIDAETFRHDGGSSGGLSVLGFHWRLGQTSGFRPEPSGKAALEPQPSPIMAGGLLAARRDWFFELGAYDPEMRLYGGEEMEIAWRIWQCGGRVEYVPCSVVGHVFRSSQ